MLHRGGDRRAKGLLRRERLRQKHDNGEQGLSGQQRTTQCVATSAGWGTTRPSPWHNLGTADGSTRKPEHCSALDISKDEAATQGGSQPGRRGQRPAEEGTQGHLTTPMPHTCQALLYPASVPSCTCLSHCAGCHSYFPDTSRPKEAMSHAHRHM